MLALVVFLAPGALAVIGIGKLSDNSKVDDERAAVTAAAGSWRLTSPRSTTRGLQTEFANTQSWRRLTSREVRRDVTAFAPLYRKGKVVQNTSGRRLRDSVDDRDHCRSCWLP